MENAYLFELLAGVAYLIAGYRLALLARRTRAIPERLLATAFLCVGLSYTIYQIPVMLDAESISSAFVGRVLSDAAAIFLLLFIWRVFRPGIAWATGLVWANVFLMLAGISLSALGGDFEGYDLGNPWFWLEWWGYTLPYSWLIIEAILAYLRAQKLIRIGLSGPMAGNRYLMWGLHGVFAMIANLLTIGMYRAYELTKVWQPGWDMGYGFFEMLAVAAMWLVFFPPALYLRLLSGRQAAPDGPEGEVKHGFGL